MPYKTVEDAEKKNKGLSKYSQKAKRGWVSSFNQCMESGGPEDKCFATAYSVANGVDGKKSSMVQEIVENMISSRIANDYLSGCGCGNENLEIELDVNDFEESEDTDE